MKNGNCLPLNDLLHSPHYQNKINGKNKNASYLKLTQQVFLSGEQKKILKCFWGKLPCKRRHTQDILPYCEEGEQILDRFCVNHWSNDEMRCKDLGAREFKYQMTKEAKAMEHQEIAKRVCENAESCDGDKPEGWTDWVNASSYKALRFCDRKGFGIIHERKAIDQQYIV